MDDLLPSGGNRSAACQRLQHASAAAQPAAPPTGEMTFLTGGPAVHWVCLKSLPMLFLELPGLAPDGWALAALRGAELRAILPLAACPRPWVPVLSCDACQPACPPALTAARKFQAGAASAVLQLFVSTCGGQAPTSQAAEAGAAAGAGVTAAAPAAGSAGARSAGALRLLTGRGCEMAQRLGLLHDP